MKTLFNFVPPIRFSGQIQCSFDNSDESIQKDQTEFFWLFSQWRYFIPKKKTQIWKPYLKLSLKVWKDCKLEIFLTKGNFSPHLSIKHFFWKFEDQAETLLAQGPWKFSLEVRKKAVGGKIQSCFCFALSFPQTRELHHWQRCSKTFTQRLQSFSWDGEKIYNWNFFSIFMSQNVFPDKSNAVLMDRLGNLIIFPKNSFFSKRKI